MNTLDYIAAKQSLLHTAMLLSPSDKEHRGFTGIVHECERDALARKEVIARLLYAMLDGLCYGNWPQG